MMGSEKEQFLRCLEIWDKKNSFSLEEVAWLWCEKIPTNSRPMPPDVSSRLRLLVEATNYGSKRTGPIPENLKSPDKVAEFLRKDPWNPPWGPQLVISGFTGEYPFEGLRTLLTTHLPERPIGVMTTGKTLANHPVEELGKLRVYRESLARYAELIGEKPAFLFPEKRELKITKWDDVVITIYPEKVIDINGEQKKFSEKELIDQRSKKPNQSAVLLKSLGTHKVIPSTKKDGAPMRQDIYTLSNILRNLTGLRGNPFQFIRGQGYFPLFRVTVKDSAKTKEGDQRVSTIFDEAQEDDDLKE